MSALYHDRFFTLKEQQIDEPEQRSDEWFRRRVGKLSSSKFTNFLFIKNMEEVRRFYGQVWEGFPRDDFTEEQKGWVSWGVKHEDTAMKCLLDNIPSMVAYEAPMIVHTKLSFLSASADGFYQIIEDDVIMDDGVIEIKCGGKTRKAYPKTKFYYVPQCYLHMACSGKRVTIFVSWGTDYTRAWRLEWNDAFWKILCDMIHAFRRTKTDLSWDEFQVHQFHLRRACDVEVENAVPLHDGKGWPSNFDPKC
jgi:hypothetical protein